MKYEIQVSATLSLMLLFTLSYIARNNTGILQDFNETIACPGKNTEILHHVHVHIYRHYRNQDKHIESLENNLICFVSYWNYH